jgi:UDP-GlcNAc:undecaprenyl-phosphate GlcNAc-1-phosphate transferase
MLIGWLVAAVAIRSSIKEQAAVALTVPVAICAIPILDASLAVVRRALGRQPIFRGDRGHIHHRLLALGFTERRVVLMLYGVGALGAMFSIFQAQ